MFSDKLALWMFWQFMGLVNLGGVFDCVISEGHWVFVGLPNAVKAWSTQVYALFVGKMVLLNSQFSALSCVDFTVPSPLQAKRYNSTANLPASLCFNSTVFSLFFFQTKPTDDRGDDAPSRQKKNERRVPQRRKTTTEANITITNKRVSHRLGGGQSVNEMLNQHHHQQNQKVYHQWRAGKCNRFPCPSLHRELPAPPPHASVNKGGGGGAKSGFIRND
ncbi:hypothetical protein NC651_033211 [Populus alba x Populus x berolinensis]|nr:hypothetical protein NC651_033211 [Populus alba x Populus x berolinensis]